MHHPFFVCIWLKNSIFGEFWNIYLLSAQNRGKWRHKIRPIAKKYRSILIFFARDDAKLIPGEVCQVSCRYSNKWRSYSVMLDDFLGGGGSDPTPPPGGGGLIDIGQYSIIKHLPFINRFQFSSDNCMKYLISRFHGDTCHSHTCWCSWSNNISKWLIMGMMLNTLSHNLGFQ